MARRRSNANRQVTQLAAALLAAFLKLPRKARVVVGVLVVVAGVALFVAYRNRGHDDTAQKPADPPATSPAELVHVPPPPAPFPPGSKDIVLAVWNLENLFDDKPDRRSHYADREFDAWLSTDAATRELKYRKLAAALLRLNAGIGPDVIVGTEVESYRAAELLKDALNAALPPAAPRYGYVAMKELNAGRHIAPCVVSRYPLSGARLRGSRQRILEVRVTANGHELDLVAAHWTSQISDRDDTDGRGREKYAAVIAELYADAIRANPKVDFLVCGDFNDKPESVSVYGILHVVGNSTLVTPGANPPKLFGLLSGRSPAEFGTHYYREPLIYDHIAVSPGMFDSAGWGFVPGSVRVPTDGLIRSGARTRRPWRFGSKDDDAVGRGYSDHFPVLVTLKVAP